MRKEQVNLAELSFLVADPNAYACSVAHSILRGFGCDRVIEVHSVQEAMLVLSEQKIDMLVCDPKLPPTGGLEFVRSIRHDPMSPCRAIPIVITVGDTRISIIRDARDSGANMVVAKPMSPSSFYDRLAWVAFHPRKFVAVDNYSGPDRRSIIKDVPNGFERPANGQQVTNKETEGSVLSQSEIHGILQQARSGDAT